LVAIHDVTEKKKARQEILDQNQRLKEIAQISSHETRKPLASILGLVSIFDKKNPGNALNKEIIQYLEISASELDKVIHSIVKKTWQEANASSETDALN
jgi:light-regulated signal transduction histidine kinase (bacteriophytochrome)